MLDLFRTRPERVDERPVEQIDRDIDDELATHLEQLQADLIDSGLSPAAAREQALSRFGNPQKHKRRCRDVALKERRMKTYTQIIVTAACGLLVTGAAASIWVNQQSANAALVNMSTKMTDLTSAVSSRASAPVAGGASSQTATVYVTGDVSNPGHYAMPTEGVSLRRMLAVAGVNEWEINSVLISRKTAEGPKRIPVPGVYLREDESKDVALQADDLLTVVKEEELSRISKLATPAHMRSREPRAGELLFVTGDVSRPGQYAMPTNGITLRRLMVMAGIDEREVNNVVVTRGTAEGSYVVAGEDLRGDISKDMALKGGDLVSVVKNEKPRSATDKPADVVDPVEAVAAVDAIDPAKPSAERRSRPAAGAGAAAPVQKSVYIAGSAAPRPGQYAMPADGLSLRRLLAAAGIDLAHIDSLDLRHKDVQGKVVGRSIEGSELRNPGGVDVDLQPDDLITVNATKH